MKQITKSKIKWEKVRFDEICTNISDRIDDPKQSDTNYYVGLEHLDSEEPKILRHGTRNDVNATKLKFKSGHILFGKRRWYQRKLAIADRDGICSAHMLVLEAKEGKVTKRFLPYLMQSEEFFERALMISEGSLSPTIKWRNLAKQEFYIPSLSQQQFVINLLTSLDDTILKMQKLLESFYAYKKSKTDTLFNKGFGHSEFKKTKWYFGKYVTIPTSWAIVNLSSVCEKINDGTHKTPTYVDEGIPFLSTENIRPFSPGFDFTRYKKFISKEEHVELSKRCNPKKGDILVSKCGTIGRTKLIDIDSEISIFVGLMLLKLNHDMIDGTFLELLLNSDSYVTQMENLAPGSTRKTLTIGNMSSLKIILPPMEEQKQISSILNSINIQQSKFDAHLSHLKSMRKSILSFFTIQSGDGMNV